MKTLRNNRRRTRGQSVTEFALMMPIIMAFFFYIFEANIHMVALHQGAYASYAAARGRVTRHDGKGQTQKFKSAILTGKIWNGSNITDDGEDGVKTTFGNFASLPYVRCGGEADLCMQLEVPTHLGREEWGPRYQSPRDSHGTNKRQTDNNLTDN